MILAGFWECPAQRGNTWEYFKSVSGSCWSQLSGSDDFFFRNRNSCWWGQPPFPPGLAALAACGKPSAMAGHHGWCAITKDNWTQCFCVKRIKSVGSLLQIKERESYLLPISLCQMLFFSISINLWYKDFVARITLLTHPEKCPLLCSTLLKTRGKAWGLKLTLIWSKLVHFLSAFAWISLSSHHQPYEADAIMMSVLLMKKMHMEMWSNFPKGARLVCSKAGIWTHSDSRIYLFHLLHPLAPFELIKACGL